MKYFVKAVGNASGLSREIDFSYCEGDTPELAMESFVAQYKGCMGLYYANLYGSADDYYQDVLPLAIWRSKLAKHWEKEGQKYDVNFSYAKRDRSQGP